MSCVSGRVRFARNPFYRRELPSELVSPTTVPDEAGVVAFHRSLPGYRPTPLVALPALAADLGLGGVWIKDESQRFGLNAFKALGASYAVHRFLRQRGERSSPLTFSAATAGNHGRAVAWSARTLGYRAVLFVPRHTVSARIQALRAEGAEVVVVDGTYDDAVRRAARESATHGWQMISDMAYPGYLEIPSWTMAGYVTLFAEVAEQLPASGASGPDVVLLQAGAGGLAGAGTLFHVRRAGAIRPRLVAVEPIEADGLLESIRSPDGAIRVSQGRQQTIMAGLNAGTPSPHAWPLIRAGMDAFLAIDDAQAADAVRRLHAGTGGDPRVVGGPSGAAGLAGLLALCRERMLADARGTLGLDRDARVLLVLSEGATDPAEYREIVGADP